MRLGIKLWRARVHVHVCSVLEILSRDLPANCDSYLFFFSLVTHMLAQLSVSMDEGWWTLVLQ